MEKRKKYLLIPIFLVSFISGIESIKGITVSEVNTIKAQSYEDSYFKNISTFSNKIKERNDLKRKELKQEMIENSENLMVCMNSLKYVTKDYNIVDINEIETFVKKWCFNDTLDGVQKKCYDNFIRVLQNADKIILLDAFITRISLDFLRDMGISYTLVKTQSQ
jgi:hypothetical protein